MKGRKWYSLKKVLRLFNTGTSICVSGEFRWKKFYFLLVKYMFIPLTIEVR